MALFCKKYECFFHYSKQSLDKTAGAKCAACAVNTTHYCQVCDKNQTPALMVTWTSHRHMLHLEYCLPLPQRAGQRQQRDFWWEVVVVCILANSNQHTTPTMLDTLYTSDTYFLRLLPPNIEKEKLQAKLDTKVRTARGKIIELGNYYYQLIS